MKKITAITTIVIFIFITAGISSAADEFQIKGIVTKNNNQITIKDNQGKEINMQGYTGSVKAGDKVLVNVSIHPDDVRNLTAQEKDFLTKQCLIDRADIDIIPGLKDDQQAEIIKWIADKNCNKLAPFRASRNYYRQLKPGVAIPLAPAGWGIQWLTDKEFQNYLEIMNNAPW